MTSYLIPLISVETFLLAILSGGFLCIYRACTRTQRRRPPGPKLRPLIGNLLEIPRKVDLKCLTAWKEQYGDLVYLRALGQSILILNSVESIRDLLDKRSHIYSHRPNFVMLGELMGVNQTAALIQPGPGHRQLRKLLQYAMTPAVLRKHRSMEESVIMDYMTSLIRNPEDFADNLRFAITRIIMAFTYGLLIDSPHSEYAKDAENAIATIAEAEIPGAYLVDFIPALRYLPSWLPLTSSIQKGQANGAVVDRFVTRPFEYVKAQMKLGNGPPSFVSDVLSDMNIFESVDAPDMEHAIKWAAGSIYIGGQETTFATLWTFILAMTLYPDIQSRAQAEIDHVVGKDRLVTTDDVDNLPYVSALIQEVMRWHVVVPLGLARRTSQDDEYRGYHIPANTIVMANMWAISQMDDTPEVFDPERFLRKDPFKNTAEYVFGFGKRVCAGRHFAEMLVFQFVANILAKFEIRPPTNQMDGSRMPQDLAFAATAISPPEKFQCSIQPRYAGVVDDLLQRDAPGIRADLMTQDDRVYHKGS